MSGKALALRWLNDACYQLCLPDGQSILIDPYISHSENRVVENDAVEQADFILLSHVHFDHLLDLAPISQRCGSKIFVGARSALPLAQTLDLPAQQLFPVLPGEAYEQPGFSLSVLGGKHVPLGDWDRASGWGPFGGENGLPDSLSLLNLCGSLEYCNFLLTLDNGLRVLIWGGFAGHAAAAALRGLHPNLMIAQFGRNDPELLAALCAQCGPGLLLPHHHELIQDSGYMQEMARLLAAAAPHTRLLDPKKGAWYTIDLGIREGQYACI